MESILAHVDWYVLLECVVIATGAVVGSFKASTELDKNKSTCSRALDVVVGAFCGIMVAYHFHNEHSIALSGLLGLVGGVSGASIIEVVLQMAPGMARKFIKSIIDSK